MADIQQLLVRIDASTEALRRELLAAERQVAQTGAKIDASLVSIEGTFASLGAAAKAFGAGLAAALGPAAIVLALIETTRRLVGFEFQLISAGDAIAKTSRELGISSDAFQELSHAADMAGVSSEEFERVLKTMNSAVVDFARTGKGPAADALKELGLAQDILSGRLKGTDAVFTAIVQQLGKVGDAQRRAALEADLFGQKAGPKLASLIDDGVDALQQARQEAHSLGIVMDQEMLASAERLNDAWSRIAGNAQGIGISIGSYLIPALDRVLELISDLLNLRPNEAIKDLEEELGNLTAARDRMIESFRAAPTGSTLEAHLLTQINELNDKIVQAQTNLENLRKPKPTGPDRPLGPKVTPESTKALEDAQKKLENFKKTLADLQDESAIARLPESMRDMAQAAHLLGVAVDPEKFAKLSPELQHQIVLYGQLKKELKDLAAAEKVQDLAVDNAATLRQLEAQLEGVDASRKMSTQLVVESEAKRLNIRAGSELYNELEAEITKRDELQRALEDNARARELERQTQSLQLQVGASTNVQDVLSRQLIGVESVATRVQARLQELPEDQRAASEAEITRQAQLQQQLALTNAALQAGSDTAAQFAEAMIFEDTDTALQGLARSIVQLTLRLAASVAMALALRAALGDPTAAAGAGGAGVGPAGLLLGTFAFGGGRQRGGPVRAGEPVVVGEAGSELFIPSTSGTIMSHGQMAALRHFQAGSFPSAVPPSATAANANRAGTQAPKVEFKIIDQRGAGAPPIEVSQQQGSDGRQIMTAVVRGGLSEMQRTGELATFLRRNYGARPAPR